MAWPALRVGRFGGHGDTTLLRRPWARSTRYRAAHAPQSTELGRGRIPAVARVEDRQCRPRVRHEEPKPVGFFAAAVFQWINPKAWLVAVSAAGTYLQAVSDNVLFQAMALGALFFAAAILSGLVWLALGASVHVLLRDDRSARMFNIAMGVALAASVATMFL